MGPLSFLVPPSTGQQAAASRAEQLGAYLAQALGRPAAVRVSPDYQAMERELLGGQAQGAWPPPLVYARTEAYGGRVLARCVRHGEASYRAALVARRGRGVRLERPDGLVAAWVDRESVAGYLLPMAQLRTLGVQTWRSFRQERFVGSYQRALEEVLQGSADLAAVWAQSQSGETGLGELLGGRASEFEVLAYTRECPNDGVVASPRLPAEEAEALGRVFWEMDLTEAGRALLAGVFHAERFAPADPGGFREIYELVFAALPG